MGEVVIPRPNKWKFWAKEMFWFYNKDPEHYILKYIAKFHKLSGSPAICRSCKHVSYREKDDYPHCEQCGNPNSVVQLAQLILYY